MASTCCSIAGIMMIVVVVMGGGVAAQSSPAGAPGPMMGAPGPMMAGGGRVGMAPAPAPGPSGVDCVTALSNVYDCLSYVMAGSNLTKPDPNCCQELAGLVNTEPICLCELLSGNATQGLGIEIDINKALKLSSVCSVVTPPISMCSVYGYPVVVPMPSGAPSPAPGSGMPESPKNGNEGILVSQLSILAALTISSLTLLRYY